MSSNLYMQSAKVDNVLEVALARATPVELVEISNKLALGLSLDEMKTVQAYFKSENRNPSDVELQTISQTWSEHCCHKTFKGNILFDGKEINSLFKTYIAKVTKEINAPWCFNVFEDNAGIVKFDKGFGIAAKVETHNHPSAVDPFGGAANGIGGVVRDILGVWADPIACTGVSCFGPLNFDYNKLFLGVKHPRYLYRNIAAGLSFYSNNLGVPIVNGATCFDESYTGNVVACCGCFGLLPLDKYLKNAKAGDYIVMAGGKTGRDGIHGVTFASAELTKKSEETSNPAVQTSDPIAEEKLKRAIIIIRDLQLASAITDLGGGGLSSAVGETAERYHCGATVELSKVPVKYSGLAPWEIYISESQERQLFAVPPEHLDAALAVFKQEEVEATAIGQLTSERRLKIKYQTVTVADVDMTFLFNIIASTKQATLSPPMLTEPELAEPADLTNTLIQLLGMPNIASKESVAQTYDYEVKGNTVLKPFQGKYAGPNDAAVLKPLHNSWKGLAISCGINPNYGKIDPYWMAASSIDEAIRNNIAVGGRRIALLDNFIWGNPEKPERLGSLVRACQACYDIAKAYRTPFISGKDSLYNESPMGPVTPTLIITALGIVPDIRSTISMNLKTPENLLYLLGNTYPELGGSEYYKLNGHIGLSVPKLQPHRARKNYYNLTKAIGYGMVKSCHDLSDGGLAVAAAEMAFASNIGLTLDLKAIPNKTITRNDFLLFSESNSRLLIEVSPKDRSDFEALMKNGCTLIGETTKTEKLQIHGLHNNIIIDAPLTKLRDAWKKTLAEA
ncbi:MAG: phosphoribosylformylglycinamidine synthase subunit PurL [Candidatus Bathyarchaeota archaeon]|uniref:phosphoribosylformylglycinamidine synthase subunit PurL n=1 Tax=Candidatus Bathycorpusculum sp. TaxID=2994959 RepID=UPI0028250492|nr:phosphoribosylformylglycinamidine synthase subunit PurL [Candidatus Termiticorpusculum sp.]MCL2257716.1 phosphoribosylformylglycinamidine synthase subunit PurL [Candidatus Termiticorpusculum sp.]MCL2292152.1 phosphoribosylformylglycinamidine synthase subunit PurL [Candidatus Termiticorpusculum sp.]